MSNRIFPSLAGQDVVVSRDPEWKTTLKESVTGREVAAIQRPYPLWIYGLKINVLREGNGFAELSGLLAFYNLMYGRADTFLYLDPDYNTVVDQAIGTGDGQLQNFQLQRQVGNGSFSWLEPVWAPTGTPVIKLNGSTQPGSAYSLSTAGVVQFVTAPSAGVVVSWSGTYAMRCRFTQDKQQFRKMLEGLHEAPKIEFRTVLP